MGLFFADHADMWLIEKRPFYIVKSHFWHLGFAEVASWSVNGARCCPPGVSTAPLSSSWDVAPNQNELLELLQGLFLARTCRYVAHQKTQILHSKILLLASRVCKGVSLERQ